MISVEVTIRSSRLSLIDGRDDSTRVLGSWRLCAHSRDTTCTYEQVTGSKRSVNTDEAGRFNLPQLKPGAYKVEISARGFEAQTERPPIFGYFV